MLYVVARGSFTFTLPGSVGHAARRKEGLFWKVPRRGILGSVVSRAFRLK
jgi:hypothetical protein